MGLYGYYRGYNNIYNEKNFNKPNDLLIDRCIIGFRGLLWSLNPIIQPYVLYGIIRRFEKRNKNLPIDREDYEW